ncbi:hypothetical protein HANVADRAFT_51214 [Hanseniaspora valbyensis NRRL Y-1626]|uniref:Uncharacterized protein n=1 Tax=Hanseniaspora valbyensis NRRL Y-1626 TaxID=766949 RepID=A0A1B7TJ19_9ASCO|nr:hypothetical protein HANVADRAFT_51214 [Hanseniaspora valbyensis NRRL Y-1626]
MDIKQSININSIPKSQILTTLNFGLKRKRSQLFYKHLNLNIEDLQKYGNKNSKCDFILEFRNPVNAHTQDLLNDKKKESRNNVLTSFSSDSSSSCCSCNDLTLNFKKPKLLSLNDCDNFDDMYHHPSVRKPNWTWNKLYQQKLNYINKKRNFEPTTTLLYASKKIDLKKSLNETPTPRNTFSDDGDGFGSTPVLQTDKVTTKFSFANASDQSYLDSSIYSDNDCTTDCDDLEVLSLIATNNNNNSCILDDLRDMSSYNTNALLTGFESPCTMSL